MLRAMQTNGDESNLSQRGNPQKKAERDPWARPNENI